MAQKSLKLKNYTRCETVWSMGTGLMFKKPQIMVFDFKKQRRISLHMVFVFYPIDVYFVDDRKKIIEIKKQFMPFNFYTSRKKARYVIETPVREFKLRVGDFVKF